MKIIAQRYLQTCQIYGINENDISAKTNLQVYNVLHLKYLTFERSTDHITSDYRAIFWITSLG